MWPFEAEYAAEACDILNQPLLYQLISCAKRSLPNVVDVDKKRSQGLIVASSYLFLFKNFAIYSLGS